MAKTQILLVTGLGSSLPFIRIFFQRWAKKLKKKLERNIYSNDVEVNIVSSDGSAELKYLPQLKAASNVIIVGHSNGFRDGLKLAAQLPRGKVSYFAGIDMTLAPMGAVVTNSIRKFHEFHAKLKYAEYDPTFVGSRRTMEVSRKWGLVENKDQSSWNTSSNKGHTPSASDKNVQELIYKEIIRAL